MQLSFVTLNCWGVHTPVACEKRHERMRAIAEELRKGKHDIIALQEVWSQADGAFLEQQLLETYPHQHRWHSQLIGSGLALFSKFPILDSSYLRYRLNGYAHCFHHGDWYCGKGAGMARLACGDFRINVYVTHMVAQYHHPEDEYHGHRVVQNLQLASFVRQTAESCDAVFVAGDLNSRPDSVGFRLLVNHGVLRDAWTEQRIKPTDPGYTSNVPDNTFLAKYWMKHFPEGERLDYILFRNNQGCTVDCDESYLTMQKIPSLGFNYSDHEGVAASFHVRRNPTAMPPETHPAATEKALLDAQLSIEQCFKRIIPDAVFFFAMAFLSLLGYCTLSMDAIQIPFLTELVRFVLVFVFFYCFWYAFLGKSFEWNAYKDALGHLVKIRASKMKNC